MDFPPAKGIMSSLIRRSILREMGKSYDQRFTPDIVLDTQGSIGVVFENNLFAGDLVMNMPIPSTSWFAEDFSELRRSIDIISHFEFERIYPGHGNSFSVKWVNHLF